MIVFSVRLPNKATMVPARLNNSDRSMRNSDSEYRNVPHKLALSLSQVSGNLSLVWLLCICRSDLDHLNFINSSIQFNFVIASSGGGSDVTSDQSS